MPGVTGLTGQLRTDSRTGRLELASEDAVLDWPDLFRGVLEADELRGIVVWRAGQDAVRVVSDDLLVVTAAAALRSNLELTLPMDDSSPELDLRTGVSGFDVAAVSQYLPANKMPPTVVAWLDSALRGGRATSAELTFVGPVRAFPFDGGEGEFHAKVEVEGGQLAFVSDWPLAEDLDGTLEFVNAQFAAQGSGRLLGNRTAGSARRHRQSACRRFHAACRYDRRARSSARVFEQCAVDLALPRRGVRAARSPGRYWRRQPRSRIASAQPQRVSLDGGPRHHRRRNRVPRFRPARHRAPGLAGARRRRAARRERARHFPRRPDDGQRRRCRRARVSRAPRCRRRGHDRRRRRRVQSAVWRAARRPDGLARHVVAAGRRRGAELAAEDHRRVESRRALHCGFPRRSPNRLASRRTSSSTWRFPWVRSQSTATSARRAASPPISTRRRERSGRSSFAARRSSSAARWRSFVRSAA